MRTYFVAHNRLHLYGCAHASACQLALLTKLTDFYRYIMCIATITLLTKPLCYLVA